MRVSLNESVGVNSPAVGNVPTAEAVTWLNATAKKVRPPATVAVLEIFNLDTYLFVDQRKIINLGLNTASESTTIYWLFWKKQCQISDFLTKCPAS